MAYNVPQLLQMSNSDLDSLFSSSPARDIPDGPAKGTAIIASDTIYSPEIAEFVSLFGWQGKTFDSPERSVEEPDSANRPQRYHCQSLQKSASWLDQKECVVLDYSETSLVAQWIRDEIRLIGPSFYLGRVYWANKPLIHFCLQFGAAAGS